MKNSWVYIVVCSDGSYYTGWTTDLERRIARHNNGSGAKYTRSRRPVKLVYSKGLDTKLEAQRRERQIKHMTRAGKELLINGTETKPR